MEKSELQNIWAEIQNVEQIEISAFWKLLHLWKVQLTFALQCGDKRILNFI